MRIVFFTFVAISCFTNFPVAAERVDFAHDILPILKTACAECHSNGTYKAGFSIDTRESILESGAVTLGKSGESDLMDRLTSDDPEFRMPMDKASLSSEEIALFRAWIDEGLPWMEGFSLRESHYKAPLAPRRPDVPPSHIGCTNPIDRILHRDLERLDVSLEPISDAVFIRRASLDLIGLLPTPKELDNFLDDTRPNRRELLVRSLLGRDQAYAEHWLTFWNDALRNDYSGIGYIDGGRTQITAWLYQSLLDNMPYDEFARELINPSPSAEGFINGIKWRGRVNASQGREVQFGQNVAQVFLGLNLKCASCHDSFINDWKLKDAYGMAAVIAQEPLEIHRCDQPTGEMATAAFLYPELGQVDSGAPREERLRQTSLLLTHKENGRFARTMVNRIWHRLMGRGIVQPVDEMDNPPWNVDLLDYLAVHLADQHYDLKKTLELIATSHAYQSRCEVTTEESLGRADYVFRGPIARRLTAEQFFDAIWRMTDTWPKDADAEVGDRGDEPVRASLMRSNLRMRSLGRPNREQVVTSRPTLLSTLQSLNLSNGSDFHKLLLEGAKHLLAESDGEARLLVQNVYRLAFSRPPLSRELAVSLVIVGESPTAEGVADFLWVIFMLPEFQMIR